MNRKFALYLLAAAATATQHSNAADIRQVSAQACADCNSGGWCGDSCTTNGCYTGNCHNYCDGNCDGRGRRCNPRSSARDFGLNWTGDCGPIGRPARWCKCARCVKYLCDTKAAPDSGWAPPAHTPIHRTGGQYTSYYPNAFYGSPGGGYGPAAPMVYQPTDTAQLGYSYGNVPRWRPDPSKIPPVPMPSNFHARFCPRDSHCNVGVDYHHGQCIGDGMIIGAAETPLPQGYVRYTPGRRQPASAESRPTTVASKKPVMRTEPKLQSQPQQPQPRQREIRTVSNTPAQEAPPQKLTVLATKAVDVLNTPAPAPQSEPAVQQKPRTTPQAAARSTSSKSSASRKPTRQRQGGRSQRSATNRGGDSGGWFGLPSLSEMRFTVE